MRRVFVTCCKGGEQLDILHIAKCKQRKCCNEEIGVIF